MSIKPNYKLQIVVKPKPLIWDGDIDSEIGLVAINPHTTEVFARIMWTQDYADQYYLKVKQPNSINNYKFYNIDDVKDFINIKWNAEIEAKIAEFATLSIELK